MVDPNDEVFLYRFDNQPELVEGWTRDKRRVSESLNRIQPRGSTSLYDAVADAVRLAQQGHNRKKAVVIISDGNDTTSRTDVFAVKQLIRETEVLVYAIGIDSAGLEAEPLRASLCQRGGREPAAAADSAAVSRCPAAGVRPISAAAGAVPVPQPPTGGGGGGGGGARRKAAARATTASTSRRCATSPTTAAGAPRSSAGCATSIPPSRASPTS